MYETFIARQILSGSLVIASNQIRKVLLRLYMGRAVHRGRKLLTGFCSGIEVIRIRGITAKPEVLPATKT